MAAAPPKWKWLGWFWDRSGFQRHGPNRSVTALFLTGPRGGWTLSRVTRHVAPELGAVFGAGHANQSTECHAIPRIEERDLPKCRAI